MLWQNSVMLIARIARVRYLVIGAGEFVIFNEHMIRKWSECEIYKEMTVGIK